MKNSQLHINPVSMPKCMFFLTRPKVSAFKVTLKLIHYFSNSCNLICQRLPFWECLCARANGVIMIKDRDIFHLFIIVNNIIIVIISGCCLGFFFFLVSLNRVSCSTRWPQIWWVGLRMTFYSAKFWDSKFAPYWAKGSLT